MTPTRDALSDSAREREMDLYYCGAYVAGLLVEARRGVPHRDDTIRGALDALDGARAATADYYGLSWAPIEPGNARGWHVE